MNLIAETAWHHEGDFDFFQTLVTKIANETEADYIKFHISIDVDEYMHSDHPGYELTKKWTFSTSQWATLFNIVTSSNKKLMLLFNDKKAIDFGMSYNPELVEIHSVCLNDIKLLNHLKNSLTGKEKVVIGVGGSTLYDIENALNELNTNTIVLMHGFQNYPTQYENINFGKVKKIMHLFPEFEHGYADHTAWNDANNVLVTLLGSALGMNYLEKHVTIQPGEERNDWQAAIPLDIFNEINTKLEVFKACYGNGNLSLNKGEESYSSYGIMKKAAILNKDVKAGNELNLEDFNFKRTGNTSDLSQVEILNSLGKKIKTDLLKGHCIVKSDIES